VFNLLREAPFACVAPHFAGLPCCAHVEFSALRSGVALVGHSSMSAEELIRACAEGNDDAAWEEFVARFHRPISLSIIRASYLASSGPLEFVGGDTGNPDHPGSPAIYIDGLGHIGIGGDITPGRPLEINRGAGHAIADGWDTYSSRRWKTNIQTLPNALSKVQQLRGVSYDLKDSGKHEIGVIAEEVGAVVPEVVTFEKNGKDAQGVDYSRLTALLIEAVKQQPRQTSQQQKQIQTQARKAQLQQSEIARMREHNAALEARLAKIETNRGTTSIPQLADFRASTAPSQP